ncbi:Uncharacterized phage-associated protein [Legionella busanensis]|uniref:Uncharacterized phage-associated protein n=1 Tax=Legionella busanensis TaxID=190655 RepID=A0A378JP52_9GAMM|nr:type II toxin-antitoxin system antitoxin SocA domain-containing protein [Legionella busanensis]STX52491.1 Uncharacterized phage-associated protein [Legionella busanensis]
MLGRVAQPTLATSNSLNKSEKDSIDSVLSFYGSKSSQWLSDLTHSEEPYCCS